MDKTVPLLKIPSFASDTSSDAGEVRRPLRAHFHPFSGNNDWVGAVVLPSQMLICPASVFTCVVVWSCHWSVVVNMWADVLLHLVCFRTGPGLSQPCGPAGRRAEVSYYTATADISSQLFTTPSPAKQICFPNFPYKLGYPATLITVL